MNIYIYIIYIALGFAVFNNSKKKKTGISQRCFNYKTQLNRKINFR